jgi:hypothetical protein
LEHPTQDDAYDYGIYPPDQAPDDEVDPISIIGDQLAPGVLTNMYNVRTSFPVGLGTPHEIHFLGPLALTRYTSMTRNKWNSRRLDFNSPQGAHLRDLLHAIYQSVIHHQEQLVFHGISSVYALPWAKKILGTSHSRICSHLLRSNSTSNLTGLTRPRFGETLQTRNVPTRRRKIIMWMLRLTRRCR